MRAGRRRCRVSRVKSGRGGRPSVYTVVSAVVWVDGEFYADKYINAGGRRSERKVPGGMPTACGVFRQCGDVREGSAACDRVRWRDV